MKIFELPQKENVKIYCDISDGSTYCLFDHMDGMYGFATTEKGGITHLYCAAEVEPHKDGYKLILPKETE